MDFRDTAEEAAFREQVFDIFGADNRFHFKPPGLPGVAGLNGEQKI